MYQSQHTDTPRLHVFLPDGNAVGAEKSHVLATLRQLGYLNYFSNLPTHLCCKSQVDKVDMVEFHYHGEW